MHAFLVTSPPSLYPPGPDCLHLMPENSLGIAEVRQIQAFLSRKPLRLPVNVVIIHQAEKLTLPAQHALLKTLEEPPGNSLIYLITAFPDQLLPTILSRVQIIDIPVHKPIDELSFKKSEALINQILAAGVGERLVFIQEQNFTRDSALEFLDYFENILHQKIASPSLKLRGGLGVSDTKLEALYNLISQTRKYLTANVHVRLAMSYFVIHL